MIRILTILGLLAATLSATAQNCDDAALEKIPGKWKAGEKGSMGITGADLVKAKNVTAFADNMIRPGFEIPNGIIATYSTAFFGLNKYNGNDLVFYNYTDWFNHYMCYNNNQRVNPDAQIILRITFNDPDITFTHDVVPGDWDEKEKDRLGWLDNFPDQKNGIIYMKATPDSAHFTRKPDRWLITYDNKLPFAYVSRLEYLQMLKAKLLKSILKETENVKENNPIRPKAVQEKEKNDMLQKLKDDAAKGQGDWTNQYLRNYRTDEQIQEENIRAVTDMYKVPLQRAEAFLKKPESELQQPAIVIINGDFNGFLNEGERGAVILIKENRDYYNQKLAKAIPQVIFVSLTRYKGSYKQNYLDVYDNLRKRLDLQQLQAMLGRDPAGPIVQTKPETKPAVVPKKEPEKKKPEFDVYKKTATPGYTPTNLAAVKKEAYPFQAIDAKAKAKALAMRLKESDIPVYINTLLTEIEKNLSPQQKKNTTLLYEKLKTNPVELADAGAMIYFKSAVNESLWCLAKAASLQPGNKYILSNLGAILNLADAPVWSLPVLRYLNTQVPKNSTILNNLGQSLFALEEITASKTILDSCIRIYAFHQQANMTQAIIADKEGRTAESVHFIEKSLEGAYSEHTAQYAKRRNINLDYSKLLNRYRPTSAEYINPRKFLPPPQCTNVFEAAELEARWSEWRQMVNDMTNKIKANLAASGENSGKDAEKAIRTGNASAYFSVGPLSFKAEKLYKALFDQLGALQVEAQQFSENEYKNSKQKSEDERIRKIDAINKKYGKTEGEGTGFSDGFCKEINEANNAYLLAMAYLNDDYNARFSEPIRQLRMELMYWSQLLPMNSNLRDGLYYEHALFAIRPVFMEAIFIEPCNERNKQVTKKKKENLPDPYCPISFGFKIAVVKVAGDCNRFDLEIEVEGLVFNFEKDFVTKKATIAFGVGGSVDFKQDYIPEIIQQIAEVATGGVGGKGQVFIEMDGDGFSDLGVRGEAEIKRGDLKIGGKFGVNSGVDITPSPSVRAIGKALSESFSK